MTVCGKMLYVCGTGDMALPVFDRMDKRQVTCCHTKIRERGPTGELRSAEDMQKTCDQSWSADRMQ